MKGVWKCSLGLSLGLFAGGAFGQEVQWRPAPPRVVRAQAADPAPPPATLARPVPLTAPAAAVLPSAQPLPAATLSRPIAIGTPAASGLTDAQVKPVSFMSLLAHVQGNDTPKPLPMGPTATDDGSTLKMPTKITADSGPSLQPGFIPGPVPGPISGPMPPPPSMVGLPPDAMGPVPGPGGCADGLCGDGCCPDGCCVEADSACCPDGSGCLGKDHRFWISAEYLMWFFKNSPAPPLVTRSFNTSVGNPGTLGDPNTVIVFGGGAGLDTGIHSGARFTGGVWFTDDQSIGAEGSIFFTGQRGAHFIAGSGGGAAFYRPFFNAEDNFNAVAEEVSGNFPLHVAGVVGVDTDSRLWGAEINLRHNLLCSPCYRIDLVEGFRFVGLDETLQINENLTTLNNSTMTDAPPTGTRFLVSDRFMTQNRFYGGQIGTESEFRYANWFVGVKSKVALGDTHQSADVTGVTQVGNGPFQTGGLLAQGTNIGLHTRNRFGVVTDLGVNVGYEITDQWRVFAGYNFLYWSSVLRPGNQIDQVVAPSQLPGAARSTLLNPVNPGTTLPPSRPMYAFRGTDFWAHGVNFGLEFRY
jgi:hypothetical protein